MINYLDFPVDKIIDVARNDKFKPEWSRFIEITSDPWLK